MMINLKLKPLAALPSKEICTETRRNREHNSMYYTYINIYWKSRKLATEEELRRHKNAKFYSFKNKLY